MIGLIDYGMGNIRSVQKAMERMNIKVETIKVATDLKNCDKIVLPGVGHFSQGKKNLNDKGFLEVLNEEVLIKGKPILGICLGMQLMTEFSEEGSCEGFGWLRAKTIRFSFPKKELKIPHMGWNNLIIRNGESLFTEISEDSYFYFVHSYYVTCDDEADILCESSYGHLFVSAFRKNNIWGVQFHPEKSHDVGLQLLKNFAEL